MTDSRGPLIDRIVLNPVQKEAVEYDGGPQLVFAGAGTGKTRVLTAKIAWLMDQKKVPPGAIFAATFTNKAAREMKTRVEAFTGIPCAALWIGTFHSLCVRILRRDGRPLGYPSFFTIYDADDQQSLLKAVLKELQIDERTMAPQVAAHAVSRFKNECLTPDAAVAKAAGFYDQQVARVYKTYQQMLRKRQAMDFDDLITNTVFLLRDNPDVCACYRRMFQHVLVDEYQDTNHAQFELVRLLAGESGRVFAVGDDDQSIYGWRGARVENILSFEKVFAGTRVFKLEQNYRSTTAILDFANAVIRSNSRRAAKKLWTGRTGGDPVVLSRFDDDRQEAESVSAAVARLLANGSKPTDVMVLFRTNAQSRVFEEYLRRRNIAYVIVGGMSFYQRREIKDCLAYLRLVVNPKDDVSFDRIMNVPARGLGEKARETILQAAGRTGASMLETVMDPQALSDFGRGQKGLDDLRGVYAALAGMNESGAKAVDILQKMLEVSSYMDMLEADESEESENRIDNINELVNAVTFWQEDNPERTLADFLEEVTLVTDLDSLDKKGAEGRVSLMTLHSAKGLETKHVFLVGLEDGIIPSRMNLEDPAKVEEERRLLYVGITRAMATLACSYAEQRFRFGSVLPMDPSRFLAEIPRELFKTEEPKKPAAYAVAHRPQPAGKPRNVMPQPQERKRPEPVFDDFSQDTVQYRMGQYVSHKLYGQGRILSISGFGDDMRMTILFNDGARRKLIAKFANLEAV